MDDRAAVKLGLLTGFGVLLLSGCLKTEAFPPEPVITFKSLEQFGDSASLVIGFTDGDGDIGLNATDIQAPFDTGSAYYHNLFVGYAELRNGVWTDIDLLLPLNYRIPRITPEGQNKALVGEIAVALKPWPIVPGNPFDTVRFSVRMVDRELRESNTVITDAVKVRP